MTELDIIDYAAAHGYRLEQAFKACAVLMDDRASGSTYWHGRGVRALLESLDERTTPTLTETLDATRVRA